MSAVCLFLYIPKLFCAHYLYKHNSELLPNKTLLKKTSWYYKKRKPIALGMRNTLYIFVAILTLSPFNFNKYYIATVLEFEDISPAFKNLENLRYFKQLK